MGAILRRSPFRSAATVGISGAAALTAALLANAAHAQTFPTRAIRVYTSAEPGGGGDFAMRMLGPEIAANIGQPVVVDNRPVSIAAETVAKAQPDGYTLATYGTTFWLGPLLQPMNYDPIKDFAPVTLLMQSPNVIVVHPSLPVNSVRDLIALARSKPGALNYGAGALGATSQLAMELFKSMARVDIVRVAYKGSAPATNALISGEVQVMISAAAAVAPHIKSGRAKVLAVTTAQPSVLAPGLPTVADSGLPGYESATFYGMVTTAKTPEPVVKRLNQEVVRVLRRSDIREKFLSAGVEPIGSSPEEYGAKIKSEMSRLGKVIRDTGIRGQ